VKHDLPDIAKAAARIRATIDDAVGRFARKDRYSSGTDLRSRAREVVRLTIQAWREPQRRLFRVRELSVAIDELKLDLMLATDGNAFRSDREAAAIGLEVKSLGEQCGGWLKEVRRKGQNEPGNTPAQRAQILSGRPASGQGANS
jgi:hypothetical protein